MSEALVLAVLAVGVALMALGAVWLFGHLTHDVTYLLEQADIVKAHLDALESHPAVLEARGRGMGLTPDPDREGRVQRIAAHRVRKVEKPH